MNTAHNHYMREYMRDYRAKKREKRMCQECGVRPVEYRHRFCSECAQVHIDLSKDLYRQSGGDRAKIA